MQKDNLAHWDKQKHGFYEVWYLKLNAPQFEAQGTALWLRFTTLSLNNGLKKVAEVWAIFFESQSRGSPIRKVAIKNTVPAQFFKTGDDGQIAIEDCVLGAKHTRGRVKSRGHQIEWNLNFEPNSHTFFHVPRSLRKFRIAKSVVCKPNINIKFTGNFAVNGKTYEIHDAPGCQGHIWGRKYPANWAWAHCNSFESSDDAAKSAVIELLSAQVKLGGIAKSPLMSAIYFEYKGDRYEFNRLADAFSIRSQFSLTNWNFSADRGPLRIAGQINCDVKDMVAVTYEDTQGSFLYCNNSEIASMNLSVYFKGKLDATLTSRMTTGYETVSNQKSPYVELLI